MKKKHLWFLIPTIFAMLFAELSLNKVNICFSILSLVCMGYTFFIALIKQN